MGINKPEIEYSSNAKDIYVLAESFYLSSMLINKHAVSMGKDQEAINFIINLTSSSIVNITFATELFLKCICVIENGFFYRTHKLEQLFQYISQENQDKIIMYHDEIINCNPLNKGLSKAFGSEFLDFKSMLKQSSNAFIEFRYKFGNSKFIPYNLNDASTAIRRLIIKTKHWPRLYLPH